MKKRSFGRPSGSAALMTGVVLLCIALSGFSGCQDDPQLSGENKIASFKIGDTDGAIEEEAQAISITVPADADLGTLQPLVAVSANASVTPGSGEMVDITQPVLYTVTAENGVSRTYRVTAAKEVVPSVLQSIQIQALPSQTVYEIGESFSPKGLIVIGIYSDGAREETAYTLAPLPVPTDTVGSPEVTVSFGGKTATFTVSVRAAKLESIEVTRLKSQYAYDEARDGADIVVRGYYSDGTNEIVATGYEVAGYDAKKPGEQTLLVTLNGKTATFKVTVGQPVILESIAVTNLKSAYAYGEAFDPAGIVVRGYYSDGTNNIEAATGYEVTGYDAKKPGEQTLLVTLSGKTATFKVTVGNKPEERDITVTVGLPNTKREPEIFGIPADGIKLSTSQNNDLPKEIVISVAGINGAVYSNVTWYVDGSNYNRSNNIITIYAVDYTLKIPHYITFVGIKDGVEYSRTITFTVER